MPADSLKTQIYVKDNYIDETSQINDIKESKHEN